MDIHYASVRERFKIANISRRVYSSRRCRLVEGHGMEIILSAPVGEAALERGLIYSIQAAIPETIEKKRISPPLVAFLSGEAVNGSRPVP